jgi:glutathione S-transferase
MDRRSIVAGAGVLGALAAGAAQAQPAGRGGPAPIVRELIIYHLEGRRSERIVWLCEELGIPYKLEFKRGDLAGSMATIRQVSPLMPVAPTVKYGGQVMVESGAILELLIDHQGGGRLRPSRESPDYPYYLQWMHFAEGSLAARIIGDYRVETIQGPPKTPRRLVDAEDTVRFAEDHLTRKPWFGGAEFSAADIMMLFPLNFANSTKVVSLSGFPKLTDWKARIEARPALKKARQVALPDGLIGAVAPLPGR